MPISPSYNPNREHLGTRLPLDTPFSVILDVSEQCNFRCNYCFRSTPKGSNWGFTANNDLMTMELFERVLAQINDFPGKVKLVSLSGHGEPLCNPHIAKMAEAVRVAGIEKVDIHTNASLLTAQNAPFIANAGFTRIVISLQGLNATAYKSIGNVNINWDIFYNNIKLLYASKPDTLHVHVKISNMALNKGEEEKFKELFENISDSCFVEKAVPLWEGIEIPEYEGDENKYGQLKYRTNFCPLVFYKIFIAPDGTIFPCTKLPPPMSLGNISNVTLQQAWNGEQRLNFLKAHLIDGIDNFEPCKGCFVPFNAVTSKNDMLDDYSAEILNRLMKGEQNG